MRIITNQHKGGRERVVYCASCTSKLAITDADITRQGHFNVVRCACCGKPFVIPGEEEATQTFHGK